MWRGRGDASSKRLPRSRSRDTVSAMAREISAGGVVVREIAGAWHIALIEPQREEPAPAKPQRRTRAAVLSLPKGLVDGGEKAATTAVREVKEETGIVAEIVTKLADLKYVYVRTWGDGERVFKIVSFYLMHYLSGEIDDIPPGMRIEVKRALWVPLGGASKQMAYSGERKVVLQAQEYVEKHGFSAEMEHEKLRTGGEKPA